MAVGLQRLVRRALLTWLKADSGVTALVPAASIHPVDTPTWPFIQLHSPVTQRLRAAGVNGGLVTWDIHAFAGPKKSGTGPSATTTMLAEDHAGAIGAAIETCLADNHLALGVGEDARIELSDIRLLEDGDRDSFHWFAQINARVLAA